MRALVALALGACAGGSKGVPLAENRIYDRCSEDGGVARVAGTGLYFGTVQAAVDWVGGGAVEVCPGAHNESVVLWSGEPIELYGAGDGSSVLVADGGSPVVWAHWRDLSLSDLALHDGTGYPHIENDDVGFPPQGGGILMEAGSLTLERVVLEHNDVGDGDGGGIYVQDDGDDGRVITLMDSVVSDNHAQRGGGVFLGSGRLESVNTVWTDNESHDIGFGGAHYDVPEGVTDFVCDATTQTCTES